jgi:hypothetical protein
MRHYILFIFLLVTISACGQKNSIFKDYKFDSTYTLLSLSPMKETGLQYPDLCFIIKDASELNKLKSSWTLSKKTERIFDMSPVSLYLIKDKVLEKVWTISPVYQNVLNDGDYYEFDIQGLKKLANKFPLSYVQNIDTLLSKNDYLTFAEKCKQNSKFLFLLEPGFEYEGQFTLEVKKDNKLNSPKAAIEMLEKKYNKLVPKDSYHIIYVLTDKNLNDQSQMTLTVESSKVLYDKIVNNEYNKSSWIPSVIEVESYWTQ